MGPRYITTIALRFDYSVNVFHNLAIDSLKFSLTNKGGEVLLNINYALDTGYVSIIEQPTVTLLSEVLTDFLLTAINFAEDFGIDPENW